MQLLTCRLGREALSSRMGRLCGTDNGCWGISGASGKPKSHNSDEAKVNAKLKISRIALYSTMQYGVVRRRQTQSIAGLELNIVK